MKMHNVMMLALALAMTGCTTSELTGWYGASRRQLVVWGGAPSLLPRMHDFSLVWTSEKPGARPELPKEGFIEFFGKIPSTASAWRTFWNANVDTETPHRFGLLREADGVTLYVDGVAGQKVCACNAHDPALLDELASSIGGFTYHRVFAIDDVPYFYDAD